MDVYVALASIPDYSAGHAPLKGVATTLDGAIKILEPNGAAEYRPSPHVEGTWNGPDGYGTVKRVPLQD